MRAVPAAPLEVDQPLASFYEQTLQHVLPNAHSVARLHELLRRHIDERRGPLVVRGPVAQRGQVIQISENVSVKIGDNSPVWWIHHVAFQETAYPSLDQFSDEILCAPTHMFEVNRAGCAAINRQGWYVAHLVPAKFGRRGARLETWTPEMAAQAFLRNLHPANHFYLPKRGARLYEAEPAVLGFFRDRLRERYGKCFDEFVSWLNDDAQNWLCNLPGHDGSMRYHVVPNVSRGNQVSIASGRSNTPSRRLQPLPPETGSCVPDAHLVVTTYTATRLLFKRDAIKPIPNDKAFEIHVRDYGTFRMTVAQFLGDFPDVPPSHSYEVRGSYHYRTPPRRAFKYLIPKSN